jgi:hypothetical protein
MRLQRQNRRGQRSRACSFSPDCPCYLSRQLRRGRREGLTPVFRRDLLQPARLVQPARTEAGLSVLTSVEHVHK